MKKEYKIDKNLYKQLKSHLLFNYKKNSQDYNDIMIKIPNSARIELRYQMFMKKFLEVKFLKQYINNEKHHNFIAWINPLFETMYHPAMNIIYRERLSAANLYFIVKGKVAHVVQGHQYKYYWVVN